MNKRDVTAFFDELAPSWDAHLIRNDEVIDKILDSAGIEAGVTVLDVACGTGVLFPDYLKRDVKSVTGVDISPVMIEYARKKAVSADPRVTLIAGDIEELALARRFDRCVVYNAFPHFPVPKRLIDSLADKLTEEGRLTVAHGMSRAALDKHHAGAAGRVSIGLMREEELAALMAARFNVDVVLSDDEKYIVSGVKKR